MKDRLVGRQFGHYTVEGVLGRGGMGTVYRARDSQLDRTVALKVLSTDRATDPSFRTRFLRESKLLASIDHPNIVPVFEAGEVDGDLFIAMRYVTGPELSRLIEERGPLAPVQAATIVAQIADALDAAHAKGLIHRDIKPANILVVPGPTAHSPMHAYLTDFGLTKVAGSTGGLTEVGKFVGTPGYVAPEQIQGHPVDHRADVYSLGCVLYDCLTGSVPFPRDSTMASLWAHVNEVPPRPSDVRPAIGNAFDAVVARAMAKNPDDRYQTAGGLAAAAREAAALAPQEPAPEPTMVASAPDLAPPLPQPPAPPTAVEAAGATIAASSATGGVGVPRQPTDGMTPPPPAASDATVVASTAGAPTIVATASASPPTPPSPPAPIAADSSLPPDGRRPGRGSRGLAAVLGAGLVLLLALTALGYTSGGFGLLSGTAATATPTIGARVLPPVTPSPSPSPSPAPSSSNDLASPIASDAPPTPTPKPTPTPTPKPKPTPTPDTTGPAGGRISLASGHSITTNRTIKLKVTVKPTDPSGVTAMAVSNKASRPTKTRAYDNQFNWTLASGKAGKRTVYVWFRDSHGNWSSAVSDAITFDHAPVIKSIEFNPSFCDGSHTFDLLATSPYAATDADGQSTIKIVRVWTGGSTYPGSTDLSSGITSDGLYVKITISGSTPGNHTLTDYYTIRDNYGIERTGHFKINLTGC